MTQGVADEVLGRFARQQHDWFERVRKGSLDSGEVMRAVQEIIDRGRDQIVARQKFYQDIFGIKTDFGNLSVPEYRAGFDRIVVVQDVSLNQASQACKEQFPTWSYWEDLDASITKNDRVQSGYAIRLRDRQEADEELKNLSAEDLKKQGIPGVTLLERLIFELKYYQETGNHLDIENITLCIGSRAADGRVPGVRWRGDGLCVHWCFPRDAGPRVRAREVVF